MRGLRLSRGSGTWKPRNPREREIKNRNRKMYFEKRQDAGEAIYKAIGCNCGGRDIIFAGLKAKTPEEFLRASKIDETHLFPAGFRKQDMKDVARHVYFKVQDRMEIGQYKELVEKHSSYDTNRDGAESEKFYYVGRIAGRLGRANVHHLSLAELRRFYDAVQLSDKEDAFSAFNRGNRTMRDMWGGDCYERLGFGRIFVRRRTVYTGEESSNITIREWQENNVRDLEGKTMHGFDALCLVGRPWIDALYLGTNLLGEYIRGLPK